MYVFTFFLKVGSIEYSLGIVQWDFTRQDHLGNPGMVSGSGPVSLVSGSGPVTSVWLGSVTRHP